MRKTYNTQIASDYDRDEATRMIEALEKTCGMLTGNTPEALRGALLTAKREAYLARDRIDGNA
jgi:hypothetical protein